MKYTFFSTLIITSLLFLGSCTSEQRSQASESDSASMELHQGDQGISELQSRGDSTFVMNIARLGLAELAAAELALERVQNPELTHYAADMISAQRRGNAELKALAMDKGIHYPQDLDIEHRKILETLKTKTAEAFNMAYIDISQNHMQQAIGYLQDAAQSLEDNDLRNYATKTHEEFKVLLQKVKDVHEQLN